MAESKALHVVLTPSPGMGHLIPIVEFAKRLVHQHGDITVTIIIGSDGPPSKAETTVLDSLPSSVSTIFLPPVDLTDLPPTTRIETRIALTVLRSNPNLRRFFETFAAEDRLPNALVVDLFGTDAFDVAKEFHVSPYILFTSTAQSLSFFLHLPNLDETVSCEFWELTEPVKLPGCEPVDGKDFTDPAQDRKNDAYKWLLHIAKRYKEAEGIFVNSFFELEPNVIKALQEPNLDNPPVYPVGPLVKTFNKEVDQIEDNECLKWLDNQPLVSVLFVSFGSGGTLSHEQLNELALGLADSEQRFVWVIRSPSNTAGTLNSLTKTDPLAYLPNGFLDQTKERGFMISSWAPQAHILAHPSIGGFLTHCGWNSTLESIVNGVPLIAWPLYAEQRMNATLLSKDIRVAVRAHKGDNGIVNRAEVARVVKVLMEGEEGKGIKDKMKEMKEGASRALMDDGSSTKAFSLAVLKWKKPH